MKKYLLLLVTVLCFGCDNGTIVVDDARMIVSPTTLVFEHGDSVKMVSITHTCTCAFTWTATVTPPNGVIVDTSGTGDNKAVAIRIADRSKMTSDTLQTKIVVSNNTPARYGIDTIAVTVIR